MRMITRTAVCRMGCRNAGLEVSHFIDGIASHVFTSRGDIVTIVRFSVVNTVTVRAGIWIGTHRQGVGSAVVVKAGC